MQETFLPLSFVFDVAVPRVAVAVFAAVESHIAAAFVAAFADEVVAVAKRVAVQEVAEGLHFVVADARKATAESQSGCHLH